MKNSSYTFAIAAIILWGTTPVSMKLILREMNSYQLLFFMCLFASIALFIIAGVIGSFKRVVRYTARDYLIIAALGVWGIYIYNLLYTVAISLGPTQMVSVVNYLWPIFIVLLGIIILKEKLTLPKVIANIISFAGVAIAVGGGNFTGLKPSIGVLLAFLGAFIYGSFCVLTKKANYDKAFSMAVYFGVSAICAGATLPFVGGFPPLNIPLVGLLVWRGAVTGGLGYTAWAVALQRGETAKMSNLLFFAPILQLFFIWAILGEKITFYTYIGLGALIVGTLISNYKRQPSSVEKNSQA